MQPPLTPLGTPPSKAGPVQELVAPVEPTQRVVGGPAPDFTVGVVPSPSPTRFPTPVPSSSAAVRTAEIGTKTPTPTPTPAPIASPTPGRSAPPTAVAIRTPAPLPTPIPTHTPVASPALTDNQTKPNVVLFTPEGWDAPVLVSARAMGETSGRAEDQAFVAGRDFYLHWAIKNDSDAAISETFRVGIFVDGVLIATVRVFGLKANQIRTSTNIPIRIDTAGPHSVSLLVDATSLSTEVIEGTNAYSVSIVQAEPTPTLTPFPTATLVPTTRVSVTPQVVRVRPTATPDPTPTRTPGPTPTRFPTAVPTGTATPHVNRAPVAESLDTTASEDNTALIVLFGRDEDGDPLTFRIVRQPGHGLLNTFTSTGPASTAVTFAPDADFNGSDSFTFRVSDGQLESVEASVLITVLPVADSPVATAVTVVGEEDSSITIALFGTDADGDSLAISIIGAAEHGSLSNLTPTGPTSATVVYTPSSDYHGPDGFTFEVADDSQRNGTSVVGITVTPVNDAPFTGDRSAATNRETAVVISLVGGDIDGDPLTFSVTEPAMQGTLGEVISTSSTTATVIYTPNPNYVGPDTFAFEASDGLAGSTRASVEISVFDDRFAMVSHNEFPNAYYLDQLRIRTYLDYSPIDSDTPAGAYKLPYISIPTAFSIWNSGDAENIENLSDDRLAALGFHTRAQIAELAQQAPGSHWYVMGEPNRYPGVTGARFAPVWHYYYTQLTNADPTAIVTSPSLLNWDFTCLGCSGGALCEGVFHRGYLCGKVWAKDFIARYDFLYGEKPPIDVWTIDVYPIDWLRIPNNAELHAPIVTQQLESMRQYLDTIPEYRNTPIWITEVAIHAGYDGIDWSALPRVVPVGDYNWDLMGDYLIAVLDWLETDSAANRIEKWFFFIAWLDIVNVGGSGYMGIVFFGGPNVDDPLKLNCLGRIYRARAFGEPRVRCDHDGNVVPE